MTSFRTFFRAAVMLAVLGLLAKAWLHFGLTMGDVQAIGARGMQVAGELWDQYWQSPNSEDVIAEHHPQSMDTPPAAFVPPDGPIEPTRLPEATLQPDDSPAVQLAGGETTEFPWDEAPPARSPAAGTTTPATDAAAAPRLLPPTDDSAIGTLSRSPESSTVDPLDAIQQRLRQLGAQEQQLAPWGSGGQFVRFTCCVPWNDTPNFTRQFEAVAATPVEAVRQVAAEIAAWQAAE